MNIQTMVDNWKTELPLFREKTESFLSGELPKNEYKGFSGRFGSYAQKDGQHFMLRLRTPGGRVSREQMDFVTDMIAKYHVEKTHLTTCQTMQFHNLDKDQLFGIMEEALNRNVIIMGGGGDFPRNTMCSPLSGVEVGENFDVMDYARAAGNFALSFIDGPKMPRKLKICFSNSEKNVTHATFRDLGFVARKDGAFDVYCAGGLGNGPKLGVKVAEAVKPVDILYYVKAMWVLFRTYGNYENRGRARTRFIQEVFETQEQFVAAYNEKLAEVKAEGVDLTAEMEELLQQVGKSLPEKQADGSAIDHPRAIPQKQHGLYAVVYHPIGGNPSLDTMASLEAVLKEMKGVELRLSPDGSEYIINLTGDEAKKVIEATEADHARSLFETSVCCIGASICQTGVRDSQELLHACIAAVREAGIKDGALPKIHISGCPSSCATHQTAPLSFRGGVKKTEAGMVPAFCMFVGGSEKMGCEKLGTEVGAIATEQVPVFLVTLGKTVEAAGGNYAEWLQQNPDGLLKIAAPFLA